MILNYKKGSLIILSGIPGSGKTTFTKKYFTDKGLNDYILSSDELRERFFGETYLFDNDGDLITGLYQGTSQDIFEIIEKVAKKRCENGLTTVIDSTNLTDKDRKDYIKLGKWTEIYTIVFDENLGIENNKKRKLNHEKGYISESVIKRMLERYEKRTSIKGNKIIKIEEIKEVNEIFESVEIDEKRNILIYGDIHGIKDFYKNYKYLQEKYQKNGIKPLSIFVGDIVDRGEYSLDNLLFIMLEYFRGNAIMINGNHDKHLLENISYYLKNKDIIETFSARYKTIKAFVDFFQEKKEYNGHIEELNGRTFNLNMVYDFLNSNSYYTIINLKGENKYLITHAPLLFQKNIGNLKAQECFHSSYQFINDLKSSKEESINNKINFLKSFSQSFEKTGIKLVCGHFDLEKLQTEFNIGKGLISLEGEVDAGGYMKVLALEYNGNEIKETIEQFESHLNYERNDFYEDFYKNVLNLPNNYYFKKTSGNLSIFKYSKKVFYDNLWMKNDDKMNETLLKLRGIVFDINGKIVSYPFDKIFNHGEILRDNDGLQVIRNKIEAKKSYQFIEKLNGFLGIISPNPYNSEDLLVHTGGSIDGPFSDFIKELLNKEQKNQIIKLFKEKKLTLCFEVIHKNDPHIIKYSPEEEGLYLIGARNISGNDVEKMHMLSEEELDELGNILGFKRPKHFIETFENVKNDLINLKIEGYMIKEIGGEHILKIKSPYYLTTKFLSRMGNNYFNLLFKDKEKFIKEKEIDEEYYNLIDYIIENKENFEVLDNTNKAEFIRSFLEK